MKNLAPITNAKDVTTKEYVDDADNQLRSWLQSIEDKIYVYVGSCLTEADEPIKEVYVNFDDDLETCFPDSALLAVYFRNANTADALVQLKLYTSTPGDYLGPEYAVRSFKPPGTTIAVGQVSWRANELVLFARVKSPYHSDELVWQLIGRQGATGDYAGVVQLSDSINSIAGVQAAEYGIAYAATPKAVKTAYDLAASKQDPITGGPGVVITGGTRVGLTDKFYNYLVRQTFEKPTIAAFAVTGLGGAAEIGTSVEVSGFTHRETNIDNFDGTLTLKKGTDVLAENIAPSSAAASGSFTSQPVASSMATTVTFTLSGTDALGDSVSGIVSKTFYVPKIYGVSENSTVAAGELLAMNRVQSYGSSTTVQVLANGYIFLAVTGTITKVINADTGFGVAVTQLADMTLSINGVSKNYHVYRTDELTPQTLKMTITAS